MNCRYCGKELEKMELRKYGPPPLQRRLVKRSYRCWCYESSQEGMDGEAQFEEIEVDRSA